MTASSSAGVSNVPDAADVQHAAPSHLRAAFISIYQLYDPSNTIDARKSLVPQELANAILNFNLKRATTWDILDGVIRTDTG